MKKLLVFGVLLLFIGMSVIPSTGTTIKQSYEPLLSGNTLYVGGSGEGNYTNIQDAIDDAVDGDTVFVYNGTYYEGINVTKSINLIGENRDTTIIEYHYNKTVILSSNFSIISGFYITGYAIGVEIRGNYVTIADNNIDISDIGIFLVRDYPSHQEYHGAIISNNNIKSSVDAGIFIRDSRKNVITNNNITSHVEGGICLSNCQDNYISGNIINNVNGEFFYFGDIYLTYSYNNKIINNTLIGVKGKSPDGIQLDKICSNNIIANNSISGYDDYGIWIIESSSNSIFRNDISCNTGIGLTNSDSNSIYLNTIIDNNLGVYLGTSTLNEISQNNFNDNNKNAKFIFTSFDNIWNGNNWDGNYWDKPRTFPYLIYGSIFLFIPWFNLDWNPAQEPYDIEV